MTKIYKVVLSNNIIKFVHGDNASEALRNVGKNVNVKSIKLDIVETLAANYGPSRIFMTLSEAQAFSEQMAMFLPVMPDFMTAVKMSMSRMPDKKVVQKRLMIVRQHLESASKQSEALENAGFPKEFIPILKLAEENSNMAQTFETISNALKDRIELFRTIRNALVTPILVVVILVAALAFMLLVLYPRMADLFQSGMMGNSAATSSAAVQLDIYLTNHRYQIVIPMLILFFIFVASFFVDKVRSFYQRLLFAIPFFRDIVLTWRATRFCMAIEMPLASAMPILETLNRVVMFAPMGERQVYIKFKNAVDSGKTFETALSSVPWFSRDFVQWLGSIERAGSLANEITRVKQTYEKLLKNQFDTIKTYIGPFMLIFAGGAVLLLAVALYAPILSMMQNFISNSGP